LDFPIKKKLKIHKSRDVKDICNKVNEWLPEVVPASI